MIKRRIILYLNVGNLPRAKAEAYLETMKTSLEDSIEIDQKRELLCILSVRDELTRFEVIESPDF